MRCKLPVAVWSAAIPSGRSCGETATFPAYTVALILRMSSDHKNCSISDKSTINITGANVCTEPEAVISEPGEKTAGAIFFLTKNPKPTTYCGNAVCDHKLWLYTQTPTSQQRRGKYGSKEGKEKEEIRNEPDLGFPPFPRPAPPSGPFVWCAEHVRQLGGESPLHNLMEVK